MQSQSFGGNISCSSLAVGGRRSQRATKKLEESKRRMTSVVLTESQRKGCQEISELEWQPTMVIEADTVYLYCK